MTEFERWYKEKQIERTIKALKKNNFDAIYAPTAKEAVDAIFAMIEEGSRIGVGGSVTLRQLGFFEEIKKRSLTIINPPDLPPEEALRARKEALLSDVFVCSTNAITEDGMLYNIDGTGNRVGAMAFGPKKVIIVCGINKIVKDLDDAQKKVKEEIAPMNAKRLETKTPCVETGECADCSSPQRICNIYTVMVKKPSRTDMKVIIVGEHLGLG
ncbi:MAG: lactate utilization protein [Syntrophorhabdaceae bacterium]|nr:lactate utilization protein [Syntrophorhabdaceae bacterium]